MPSLLPATIELREGEIYPDGWASPRLVLTVEGSRRRAAILKIHGWNPTCSAKYCVNRVTLKTDEETDVKEVLLGERFDLRVPLKKAATCVCTFASEAVMPPDALDERERGVLLLSVACEPLEPKPHDPPP